MIIAKVSPINEGKFLVEFITPETVKEQLSNVYVNTIAEAERVMYFRNRNYISSHLMSWLKQRQYALGLRDYRNQIADTEVLIHHLQTFSDASFHQIQKFVFNHEAQFMELAPGGKSSHYNHFEKVILPILHFCRPEKVRAFAQKY